MKYLSYVFWYILSICFLSSLGYLFYFMYENGYSIQLVVMIALYSLSSLFNIALFSQERNESTKLSWIIVMTIIPIIGHIIFVIFGRRHVSRKNHFEYVQKDTFKLEKLSNEGNSIQLKQQNISKRGIYDADINILKSGMEGLETLFSDIEKAKEFIHINYYIIKPGEIYEHFKNILIKKAQEGVEIRIIVDDFGRWALPWYEIKSMKKHGVQIKVLGKVSFPFIGSENGYRTHKKMVIIDGDRVHTGGINIADEYAHLSKKYGMWIDYQAVIRGAAVRSYSLLFIEDWKYLTKESLDVSKYLKNTRSGKSKSILVEDSPEIKEDIIMDSLVMMIMNAKKSIKISTPYFVPTPEIYRALKTASLSGVDVTIFIPGKPDKKMVLSASRNFGSRLSKYGVKFKTANNMLIHSKIGLFDNEYAYFGTVNLDMRSFYSQFEQLNIVTGPVIKQINELFKYYSELSIDEKFETVPKNRIGKRLSRIAILIISPLF